MELSHDEAMSLIPGLTEMIDSKERESNEYAVDILKEIDQDYIMEYNDVNLLFLLSWDKIINYGGDDPAGTSGVTG